MTKSHFFYINTNKRNTRHSKRKKEGNIFIQKTWELVFFSRELNTRVRKTNSSPISFCWRSVTTDKAFYEKTIFTVLIPAIQFQVIFLRKNSDFILHLQIAKVRTWLSYIFETKSIV